MSSRLVACAFAAGLLVATGHARADDTPKPAPPAAAPAPPAAPPAAAPAPPPAAPAPQAQQAGAVVVATSDAASPAAHALAAEVYREADLRPAIDDATARVLAGERVPDGAAPRLKDLGELRASIATSVPAAPPAAGAAAPPPSDLVLRRLLASLGADVGAALVVTVAMDGSRPVARVLRTSTATFERVELGPTVDLAADGTRTFRWPGVTTTLRGFVMPPAPAAPPPPVAPGAPAAPPPNPPLAPLAATSQAPVVPEEPRPFYKSPWFWGSVAGAAAVGLGVYLITRATSSTDNVHLTAKVVP
jgi:hypothetical protein